MQWERPKKTAKRPKKKKKKNKKKKRKKKKYKKKKKKIKKTRNSAGTGDFMNTKATIIKTRKRRKEKI